MRRQSDDEINLLWEVNKAAIFLCGLLVLIAIAVSMPGCSTNANLGVDALRSEIVNRAAALEDQVLRDSKFVQCRGISVGAWVREYGSNPALAAAWRTICGTRIEELPVAPPKP